MTSKMNEFLNGGESEAANAGALTGRLIRNALKWVLVCIIGVVLIGAGQLGQHLQSVNDLRLSVITKWVEDNPESKSVADAFVAQCMKGARLSSTERTMKDRPISMYECGESLGASNLMDAIRESDSTLTTAAWPLSLVNQDK